MTDVADGNDKPAKAGVRISQGRSPAYPYIDLEKAIERAQQVRAAGAARQAMPPETFYQVWKLGSQSSGARQTMAALNHFGLADYQSRGDTRKVKLSELALKIVLDTQPVSAERDAAVKVAALTPTIHRELFEKYGPLLPADFVIQTYLVRDRGYNETAAKSLISEYKDTLGFSGLDKPDNMPDVDIVDPVKVPQPDNVAVGDWVQVEINGALQLPTAARVRAIQDHQGQSWVFIEGSDTGVLMEQVVLEKKGEGEVRHAPPTLPEGAKEEPRVIAGTRREVIALDEGDVVLTFPTGLSYDSYVDLESHLQLFLRKAKRRAGLAEAIKAEEDGSGLV